MRSSENGLARILQIGEFPPPYGGVSVHLMRLHERLTRRGVNHTILDVSNRPKDVPGVVPLSWPATVALLAEHPRSIVHFHNFAPERSAEYERLSRRHVCALSLHDELFGDRLARLGSERRGAVLNSLLQLACVVVDNPRSQRAARSLWGPRAEIRLIPEFLPPAAVPPLEHPGILELRRRYRFLLASYARRGLVHDGRDLYGVDLLLELLERLIHRRGIDAGLACLMPGAGDDDLLGIRERLRASGLADRCLLVTEPLAHASSVWRASDLVIRATNTDGSSLTVFEGLSLGVPVVASDCVERPEGTILFRTRDAGDLTARVVGVLGDLPAQRRRLRAIRFEDNLPAFLELYADLTRQLLAP